MDIIRFAINNPVKVSVGVMLVILFGLISLYTIPVQLTPDVDQPIITVETNWVGRSPQEVEREIIEEQEDKLKTVTNLKKMTATASQGRAEIKLEFYIGTDMSRVLQEVSDKLREVPEYPDDVDEPVIVASDAGPENAIAWMIIDAEVEDPDFDIQQIDDFADKRVKPFLERVEGLSRVNIYGGRKREVHMYLDPRKIAQRGITFNQLAQSLQLQNVNVSAGDLKEGRLDVRIRTVGQYDNLDSIRDTIVKYTDAGPIRVRDLGDVSLTLEKQRAFVRANGKPALAMNAIRETGSNVIQVMEGLRQRLEMVNSQVFPTYENDRYQIRVRQVYDETEYIYDAIDLVKNNLWLGGTFAVLVLLLYLGSASKPGIVLFGVPALLLCAIVSILLPSGRLRLFSLCILAVVIFIVLIRSRKVAIVSLAIPVSIVGTFVIMTVAGRNLNVISLAGLAFAVGMVVDNAIVVLENIDRHLTMGKPPVQAAFDAAKEVWGAVFASTLTTLAVFIPILTIEEEAGQLFRDIALAICAAVSLSLLISITVIPSAAARWLRQRKNNQHGDRNHYDQLAIDLFGLKPILVGLVERLVQFIYNLTDRNPVTVIIRIGIIAGFTLVSLFGAWVLMPPTSYLPSGNQNIVFGMMANPPAYNIRQNEYIGRRIEEKLRRYWQVKTIEEATSIGPVIKNYMTHEMYQEVPPIRNYFFVTFLGNIFMGAQSDDKELVKPLEGVLQGAMSGIPGSFGFAMQSSLFGHGMEGTTAIDVEVSAADLNELRAGAEVIYQQLAETFGFMMVRPDPLNFNLSGPELQVKIDQVKAKDLGIDVTALGLGVRALIDGAVIGEYRLDADSIDLLMLCHPDYPISPDTIDSVPLAVQENDGSMSIVPLSNVARLIRTNAPQSIRRIEQLRSVTFTVIPSEETPLETASDHIMELIEPLRRQGQIASDIEINLAGTADKLSQVRRAMLGDWQGLSVGSLAGLVTSRMFLAILIVYLLMAALFESYTYPLVILFTVPLATVGGFLGLRLIRAFNPAQQLDTLTMLGFVILIGVVVNNAILIVHQALNFMRGRGGSETDKIEPLDARQAIRESVRSRIRPIFMTTTTSVCGMLPLVLMPGSGSELYKGLGSVIIGGLIIATLFTLIVVPLMLSLVIDLKSVFTASEQVE